MRCSCPHPLLPFRFATLLLAAVLLLTAGSCRKQQGGPPLSETDSLVLFRLTDLPEIRLEISPEEWNKLLSNFDQNPKNETYILAGYRFKLGGKEILLDSMGIRLRGNTSRRRPEGTTGQPHQVVNPDWHHAHFALKFDKYRKEQRFNGKARLNLKWFKDDASYVREIYAYDLFRRFGVWSAPQASYCRLSLHVSGDPRPAYFGVYALVEHVDEDFITARSGQWGNVPGFLWKCGWAGSYSANFVSTASVGVEDVKLDPARSKYFAYDLKTREKELAAAEAQLTDFIRELNSRTGAGFEAWAEQNINVELLLKAYAVNVLVGMWDDYWVNTNNFYIYFTPAGKAHFIPYDYDNTLGTSLLMPNSGTQDPMQWGPATDRPLITKILAVDRWRQQYRNYLRELVAQGQSLFAYPASLQRILAWQQLVGAWVSNDTGEDMVIEDKPAGWGNAPFYRLLSGNDAGGANGPANFFTTRTRQINW
ncbi:MAG TPA: CotH kinase family protein [Lacibacter sp.]|nr:CotH kinase family protein [Lacibacter sp.]HMO90141.1 CotH kinase family protein [Lacibacter sp.]HMP87618.1 CotH kinase family protein [Lacibacter sp.]